MANDPMEKMYEAIAQLKTQEECQEFFGKLWNSSELRAMEQRIDLAMFMQKGSEYLDVLEKSGMDSETLKAIRAAMLEHGTGGIIEEIIQRDATRNCETD